ncbi:uncharacterized protein BJX67DRAFT_128451 [Aspergillus lucknowensis]|uniref:Hydrophobin n=1 Tax=Aspergillus lucknowensis TaxID=176173 RepID=A0ABR4LQE9_9EURO
MGVIGFLVLVAYLVPKFQCCSTVGQNGASPVKDVKMPPSVHPPSPNQASTASCSAHDCGVIRLPDIFCITVSLESYVHCDLFVICSLILLRL